MCPAASIWLICESQGPAGITQIYTLQQAQLIRWESETPLSSAHRAPSDNLFSRRRLHMKGWVIRQNPEGLPAALLFFFLPEKMSSRFPSQLCHFLAAWPGANASPRVLGSSSVQWKDTVYTWLSTGHQETLGHGVCSSSAAL